jgi:hypothetical protein
MAKPVYAEVTVTLLTPLSNQAAAFFVWWRTAVNLIYCKFISGTSVKIVSAKTR